MSAYNYPTAQYTAYRATGPIQIDGRLDEADWKAAPVSDAFIDIVTGEPAWFDTRVRILWDDEYLYFGFTAEETHVWATLTERDSKIWFDNDLEIFIAGRDAYYEFEINAHNTIYEAMWIWRDALGKLNFDAPGFSLRTLDELLKDGGDLRSRLSTVQGDPDAVNEMLRPVLLERGVNPDAVMVIDGIGGHVHPRGLRYGLLKWDFPGVRHAVFVDGSLNDASDVDRGWSAEIAFPWRGLDFLADGRPLPPRDGDVWRIDCSRFQHVGRGGERLNPAAGWTWNRHGHYDSHIPETFTHVSFSTASVSSFAGERGR